MNSTIALQIEENLSNWYHFMARQTDCQLLDDWGIKAIQSPISFWPKLIFNARFTAGELDKSIGQVVSLIQAEQVSQGWLVGPGSQPADLGDHLVAHGFEEQAQWKGMALDLASFTPPTTSLPGFSVERVTEVKAMQEWAKVLEIGLFRGAQLNVDLFVPLLQNDMVRFYLGRLDGLPVATSMLYRGADEAGLYLISVLPEYRGRGVGTQITLAPLLEAKQLGDATCVLQATPLGEKVYHKLGFQEYCNFYIFKWTT